MHRWIRRAGSAPSVPGDGGGRSVSEAAGPEPGDTPAESDVAATGPTRSHGGGSRPKRRRRRLVAAGIVAGVMLLAMAGLAVARPWEPARALCPPIAHPDWSVARRWDEALLDSIRRAVPNPPVHARNLFHLSVAMWDAWAAYDDTARGYMVTEKHAAGDVAAARNEAMSYAAYRLLTSRYIASVGADVVPVRVRGPHGLAVLLAGRHHHGGRHAGRGGQPDRRRRCWRPPRPMAPTSPAATRPRTTSPSTRRWSWPSPGTTMTDPNRWQPLQIANMVSQNGIPVANGAPAGARAPLGSRHGVCAAAGRGRRHADRSRSAAPAGRPGDRRASSSRRSWR